MKENITATLFVMAHLLIVLGHGKVHSHLHIEAGLPQGMFIGIVIIVSPVLATASLWPLIS